jgi:hypothetical protein
MLIRTTRKTVTFNNSFVLGALVDRIPPGSYEVETDEELVEGISFPVYRRTLTLLHVPALPGGRNYAMAIPVEPTELDQALLRDASTGNPRDQSQPDDEQPSIGTSRTDP